MVNVLSDLERRVLGDIWINGVRKDEDGDFHRAWMVNDTHLSVRDATKYLNQVQDYWEEKL